MNAENVKVGDIIHFHSCDETPKFVRWTDEDDPEFIELLKKYKETFDLSLLETSRAPFFVGELNGINEIFAWEDVFNPNKDFENNV